MSEAACDAVSELGAVSAGHPDLAAAVLATLPRAAAGFAA
eukprot:gene10006-5073_t